VLCPGVEAEMDNRGFALLIVLHKDRAGVTCPSTVGSDAVEIDLLQIHAYVCKYAARFSLRCRGVDQDEDAFPRSERAHNLTVDPVNRREFSRPVGGVVRPSEPSGLVFLPLRGMAVS